MLEDNNNKEADGLLDHLHRRYGSRKCAAVFRRRRTKVAILVMIALTAVLGGLIAISLLMFKSVIYTPTPLDLCKETGYVIIPLGIYGGITEGDLTSFLLSQSGSPYFVALDAGAIFTGLTQFVNTVQIDMSEHNHEFYLFDFPEWAVSPEQQVGWIMKNKIVGYFLGHPHLDHLMGLMSIAPEDYFIDPSGNATFPVIPKSLIGLSSTLDAIKRDLFNGVVWADFPSYGKYSYVPAEDGMEIDLPDLLGNVTQGRPLGPTDFPNNTTVTFHQTCHDSLNSTAFLFTFPDETEFLFFSDTGVPSSVPLSYCDWMGRLYDVWKSVNVDKLRAIIIEVSFPNSVPDSGMYGHLRPKDLLFQLATLASINNKKSLSSLTVIVEHIKPILGNVGDNEYGSDARAIIRGQLLAGNNLNVKFIFPEQGQHICI